MVFIKPTDISSVEMVGDRDDSFAFELGWFPGMDKVSCSIAALFTLACEIGANLLWHNLWEDIGWVDGWILEIKHTQVLPLFGSCVNLDASFRLFCF